MHESPRTVLPRRHVVLGIAGGAATILAPGIPAAIASSLARGSDEPVEAIGFDGRELRRPVLAPERRRRLEGDLAEARRRVRQQTGDVRRLVWVGRRLGYLGRYTDAIEWFGTALEAHPGDPELLRHRGHRWITVRKIDAAIADLELAAANLGDRQDEVEPDGLPNAANRPTGTLGTNIHYHLGLARAVGGDPAAGRRHFATCDRIATTDDMRVAARWWMAACAILAGDVAGAREIAVNTTPSPVLHENEGYHDLLMAMAGRIDPEALEGPDALAGATLGFGRALIALANGQSVRAHRARLRAIVEAGPWAAFGAIAAEARLASLRPGS